MSHRKINNVGYKKIFPMSLFEDDSFCHYCGRTPDILNPLEWDHVPALNVKIPEDYIEIKKTLIRACRECNGLASDVPHLDYLERHFWLKAAYLRRYKRLILNEGSVEENAFHEDPFLNATINNAKLRYQQLLDGIGFGIKDIAQIESPILEVKTKKGRKVANLIIGHLRGFPSETDEQDDANEKQHTVSKANIDADTEINYCNYGDFIGFIAAENEINEVIGGQEDYENWYNTHPSRFEILELPKFPEKSYMTSWFSILSATRKTTDFSDMPRSIDWSETPCSFDDFLLCLVFECDLDSISTELDYINWSSASFDNKDIVEQYRLPNKPCDLYDTDWNSIYLEVVKRKQTRNIRY